MVNIVSERLAILQQCSARHRAQPPIGVAPAAWLSSAGRHDEDWIERSERLPRDPISREYVRTAIHADLRPLEELVAMIFAWGGMDRRRGTDALSSFPIWRPVIEDLRKSTIMPPEAYERFATVRRTGVKGMGPAYFTKLIFFFTAPSPTNSAYIMDQWTGLSANYLTNSPLVKLTRIHGRRKISHWVNDKNNARVYSEFCELVDKLALSLNVFPKSVAEEMIFSEGYRRGLWRNHLVSNCLTVPIG